ncbi:MAG: alanine racemase [Deltaproteobacteria bacterium]|jgi:alanine racemase|nr:alanine racemase [Deltaproteobacteria bacterium]
MANVSAFNRAVINMITIKDNFRAVRQITSGELMAVIKGDAYGHGLTECAASLTLAGASQLGVLDIEEACTIVRAGIKTKLNILAGLETSEHMKLAVDHKCVVFVYRWEQLAGLSQVAEAMGKKAEVRLKIDTGMGRLGFPMDTFAELIRKAKTLQHVKILGLATHLATYGDNSASWQLKRFADIKSEADRVLGYKLQHSALSSGGLLVHPDYSDDLSRVGILLYGYSPLPSNSTSLFDLPRSRNLIRAIKPVMTVTSKVLSVRTFKPEETIGYDRTFTVTKEMKVATVPYGYVHGMSRTHSGRGGALIGGRLAPILGRVSMNLSAYDVTKIAANPGHDVVIIGSQGGETIGADLAGTWQDTNAYEILCLAGRLSPRVHTY